MKTRAEIYGNEAAALLRIVTMYPGLNMQQLLCFHPGKEEIIKTLLSHLQKQGRIFQTDTGGYFPSGWAAKSDNSLIRAAWVLLDFIGQVEYHAPGDFPVKLIFFANGELYEIVYAASGQEALINHALRDDRSGGRRIILVDNPEDIRRIDCPGISGFCTVDAAGQVHYFTAEFISARTGLASVAVSSKSKQLGTWRISNYTPEFRETSGVGKRPVLTPDEVLRLPLDQALIIIRGKKVLQVDKMDYSKHPEAKYLRSCKASAHVPEWRRLEEEAAKTPQPAPKPAPAAKKPAKRKATKPASPTDKSPKEAPAPKSAGTPEGIITTDKDSILS